MKEKGTFSFRAVKRGGYCFARWEKKKKGSMSDVRRKKGRTSPLSPEGKKEMVLHLADGE